MSLRDGLRRPGGGEQFSAGLFNLLRSQSALELPLTEFCGVLTSLDAANWTTATYFAYLMWPDCHIFLKPLVTKRIAEAWRRAELPPGAERVDLRLHAATG